MKKTSAHSVYLSDVVPSAPTFPRQDPDTWTTVRPSGGTMTWKPAAVAKSA